MGDVIIFGIKENRSGDNLDKLVYKVIFNKKRKLLYLYLLLLDLIN